MPGTHVYTDKVAANMVRLLTNKLVCTQFFSRRNERDFNEGQPIGDTLSVKLPYRGVVRDGFAYVGADIDRRYTTIVADQMFGIDVNWDTIEKAIEMERTDADINENILDPLAAQLAQECDSRAARHVYLNTPNVVGALGTTPTSLGTYSLAHTRLEENAAMNGAKRAGCIITPAMMDTIIASSSSPNLLSLFLPDIIKKAFTKGYVGEYSDLSWYKSMSLYRHTTGIWATVATGVTTSSANQSGSSLAVACTTGDTFVAGDIVTIAGVNGINPMTRRSTGRLKQFKIMANVTGAASAATLSIYPSIVGPGSPYQNVTALPGNAAVLTLMPGTTMSDATAASGLFGAALTNDAFALVAIDLPMPKKSSEDYLGKYTDPETGITVGIIRTFDFDARAWKTRMDCWIGFGNLLAEQSSVLIASLN